MSAPEYELLKAVVSATCEGFGNLELIELEDSSGLGLKSLVVKRKDTTVFFPAVAGQVSKDNCALTATSSTLSAAIEENVIFDPLKIVISAHSWAANLVAYEKSIQKVLKVASLIDNVWEVDKEFFEITKTLSSYGESVPGGVKLCCGITQEEYYLAIKIGTLTQAKERTYPGGSVVFEDGNCERLVNMTISTTLPAFPFHRCMKCARWFQRHLKRNTQKFKEELSCDDSCANNPTNITSKLTTRTRKKKFFNLRKKIMDQKTEILKLRKNLVELEQSKEMENIVSSIDIKEELSY